MMRQPALTLASALLAAACGSSPPPPPPLPPPPPQPTPVIASPEPDRAPAPLPSGCDSLAEECTTDGMAPIAIASIASVRGPHGWLYASTSKGTIHLAEPEVGAVVGFARIEGSSPEVVWPALYALLGELEVTGVSPETIDLSKPEATWHAQAVELQVWEVEKPRKSAASAAGKDPLLRGDPGALLVGLAELDAMNTVLAVGFLKRSAPKSLVHPIRQTFESLNANAAVDATPTDRPTPLPQPIAAP